MGERVRFYRAVNGTSVWLPATTENAQAGTDGGAAVLPRYDVAHYVAVLHTAYVSRLRKAFTPDQYAQLFCSSGQLGLFDEPVENVRPQWIQA